MTQPTQAKKRTWNGPRTYAWPPVPPHEFEVMGVTSAINGGLPKPFLLGWAVKKTAECAVDQYDWLGQKLKNEGQAEALKWLKSARYRDMGAKADRGTIVHAAVEAYLAGKPFTKKEVEEQLQEARVPGEMWGSTAAMIAGVMEFLFDEEPEVYWSEATVYSREHGYAGTADLIARMRVGGTTKPVVLDVKTGARVYDETALQLCAYARADFVGLNDGTEATLVPDFEPIEHGVVVRPTAGGKYEKVEFTLTDDVFELFLGCLTVATKQDALEAARRPS